MRSRVLDRLDATSTSGTFPWSSFSSAPHPYSSLRSGELPPRLSDAQLATLDTLTREAIDERLRVLESVSARATMCVEELLRMRSVLPPQVVRQGDRSGRDGEAEEQAAGESHVAATTVPAPGESNSEAPNPEAQVEVPQLQ